MSLVTEDQPTRVTVPPADCVEREGGSSYGAYLAIECEPGTASAPPPVPGTESRQAVKFVSIIVVGPIPRTT